MDWDFLVEKNHSEGLWKLFQNGWKVWLEYTGIGIGTAAIPYVHEWSAMVDNVKD